MTDNGGFTLNGVPVSTYGVTLRYAPDQPMLPDTKDRTAEVLNKSGQYFIDSVAGIKSFSLPCHFLDCADASALDAKIRTFAKVFVDCNGNAKQIKLVFDDSPDLTYTVRYAGQISFDRAWVGCVEFTLDLIADDPYAYESEEEESATITTSGGSFTVESSGTISTPAFICVTNHGSAEIVEGFIITIQPGDS